MKQLLLLLVSISLFSCNQIDSKGAQGKWLKGSTEDQIKSIENQFRGFDKTMVEIGHRYEQLYWAGQDENWKYASYQLNKMDAAIEDGLERRPKRAKSADHFISQVIPNVEEAIKKKDSAAFNKNFATMVINCNSCHLNEKVPFIHVKIPVNRLSSIR